MNNYIRICTPSIPDLGILLSERDDLTYDTWGTVLSIMFDACACVTHSGNDVPSEIDYSVGLGGDNYIDSVVVDGYDDMYLLHIATHEQQCEVLLHLNQVYGLLKELGEDY